MADCTTPLTVTRKRTFDIQIFYAVINNSFQFKLVVEALVPCISLHIIISSKKYRITVFLGVTLYA